MVTARADWEERAGQMKVRGQWELITICHPAPFGGYPSRNHCILVATPQSLASWLSRTLAASSWSGPEVRKGWGNDNDNNGERCDTAFITYQDAFKELITQLTQLLRQGYVVTSIIQMKKPRLKEGK